MAYIEKHRLYELALTIWRGQPEYPVRLFQPDTLYVTHFPSKRVLVVYGEWLYDRRDFKQAAIGTMSSSFKGIQTHRLYSVFIEASQPQKAMVAYESALLWQDLFDLALREKVQEEQLVDMAYRVAGMYIRTELDVHLDVISDGLTTKKRYSEASQALLDYAKDVREAVIALVQGNIFSEARRVVGVICKGLCRPFH